jgi:predicted transcriptional regulator
MSGNPKTPGWKNLPKQVKFDNVMFKKLRTHSGMTLQGMADAVGTNKSVICKWENGTLSPRRDNLEKIVEILRKRKSLVTNKHFGPLKVESFFIYVQQEELEVAE